uniref:Uncharacterized protein n=1 Tax=Solanum tuberosum TaxID=4113 RepID=M1DEM7_SOLTU
MLRVLQESSKREKRRSVHQVFLRIKYCFAKGLIPKRSIVRLGPGPVMFLECQSRPGCGSVDTIALMRPIMENAKDSKKKLQLENKILQQQLDCLSNKSNLRAVQTEELKVELKRLKELAKTQEAEEHMETEGQSSHSYDHDVSELAADIYRRGPVSQLRQHQLFPI